MNNMSENFAAFAGPSPSCKWSGGSGQINSFQFNGPKSICDVKKQQNRFHFQTNHNIYFFCQPIGRCFRQAYMNTPDASVNDTNEIVEQPRGLVPSELIPTNHKGTVQVFENDEYIIRTAGLRDAEDISFLVANNFFLELRRYPLIGGIIIDFIAKEINSGIVFRLMKTQRRPEFKHALFVVVCKTTDRFLGAAEMRLNPDYRKFTIGRLLSFSPPMSIAVPYIQNLTVDHSVRRRGIGKLLLDVCEKQTLDWDYDKVFLQYEKRKKEVHHFYESSGYNVLEEDPFWVILLGKERLTVSYKMLPKPKLQVPMNPVKLADVSVGYKESDEAEK